MLTIMLTQSRGISLFKRITMLVTFMILCSLLVSSTLITKRVPDVFQEKLGSSAMSVAAVVSNNQKIIELINSTRIEDYILMEEIVNATSKATNSNIAVLNINKQVILEKTATANKAEFNKQIIEAFKRDDFYDNIVDSKQRLFFADQVKNTVYGPHGEKLGYVFVAFPKNVLSDLTNETIILIIISSIIGLFVGVAGAVYTAKSIKDVLLGLEPETVAQIVQEQRAILNSVREGVIASDRHGRITLLNAVAQDIFAQTGIKEKNYLGKNINIFFNDSSFLEVLSKGKSIYNVDENIYGTLLILNILPVKVNNVVVGVVATFRKKTEIEELAAQLTGVKTYAEALRANTHEFMNKLHVILGLIQLQAYDDLKNYIKEIADYQHGEITRINKHIKNAILSGFILGKSNRAKELGIEFILADDSELHANIPHDLTHKIILILGNLITNAFDSITLNKTSEQIVFLTIKNYQNEIFIMIEDSGPGMTEEVLQKAFDKNFSTKGQERGIGLYLVKQTIKELGGNIEIDSKLGQGTIFTIKLPL